MNFLTHFDLSSDSTVFYLGTALLMILIVYAMTVATGGKPKGGSRHQKYDDSIVNRDRELID